MSLVVDVFSVAQQYSTSSELDDLLDRLSCLSVIQQHPCHICFSLSKELNIHQIYKYMNQLLSFFIMIGTPIVIADLINSYIIDTSQIDASMCKPCYSIVMSKPEKTTRKRRQV